MRVCHHLLRKMLTVFLGMASSVVSSGDIIPETNLEQLYRPKTKKPKLEPLSPKSNQTMSLLTS